jgi:hypothetical protein
MTAPDPKRTFEGRYDATKKTPVAAGLSIHPLFGLPDRRHEHFIKLCETLTYSLPDAGLSV